jgi:hypothetical protein
VNLTKEHDLILTLFILAERARNKGLLNEQTRDKYAPLHNISSYPLTSDIVDCCWKLIGDAYEETTGRKPTVGYYERSLVVNIVCNEIVDAFLNNAKTIPYTQLKTAYAEVLQDFKPKTLPRELTITALDFGA